MTPARRDRPAFVASPTVPADAQQGAPGRRRAPGWQPALGFAVAAVLLTAGCASQTQPSLRSTSQPSATDSAGPSPTGPADPASAGSSPAGTTAGTAAPGGVSYPGPRPSPLRTATVTGPSLSPDIAPAPDAVTSDGPQPQPQLPFP